MQAESRFNFARLVPWQVRGWFAEKQRWWRRFTGLVTYQSAVNKAQAERIATLERVIRERTDLHVDVQYKGFSRVIVVGRFRGADYVEVYSLHERDMEHMIRQLREMEKFGTIRHVDAPFQMHAVVKERLKLKEW